jgi:hypothetical protein
MAAYDTNYIWKDRKRTLFGLPWSFTRYRLYEKKFVTSIGLFSVTEDEVDLYRISDKRLVLPFWQRMFGCGTIVLLAKDVDTPEKVIKSVKRPREVMDIFEEHIDAQRKMYKVNGRDMYGSAGEVDFE